MIWLLMIGKRFAIFSDKPLDIDAAEDFVFKTVPPKAIIKMLETFKSDMTTEGSKLIHNVDALKRLIE